MIDPNIVFNLKPIQLADPLEQQAKAQNLISGQQAIRAGQQQMEHGRIALEEQKKQISEGDQMRQLFSSVPIDKETGKPNLRAVLPEVFKINPATGQSMMKGLHDQEKSELDMAKTAAELRAKKAERFSSIAGTITDEASFHQGIASAVGEGLIDPGHAQALVQQGWNPQTAAQVKQISLAGASAKEQHAMTIADLEEKRKALDAAHKKELEPFTDLETKSKAVSSALETAGRTIDSVKDQAGYQQWAASQPKEVQAVIPPSFDDKTAAKVKRMAMSAEQQSVADVQAKNAENNVTEYELRLRAAKGDKDAAKTLKDAEASKIRVAQVEAQNKWNLQMGSIASADGKPSEAAQAIANYQVPLQVALSRLPAPARELVLKQVRELNPNYDASHYDVARKTEMDATTGNLAKTSNSQSTAIAHMDVLNQAVDALKNGDIRILNQLGNALGVQVGKTPKTAFEAIVHKVGPELASAYLAGGGSVGERGATEKDFDPSLSPDQLKSNISVSAKLLEGKIKANQEQYQRGTYGRGKQQLLTPEASEALKRLSSGGTAGAATKNPYR